MIVQEKVNMDGEHLSRRCNELGLKWGEFTTLPWSPMFCVLIYGETETTRKAKDEARRKAEAKEQKRA